MGLLLAAAGTANAALTVKANGTLEYTDFGPADVNDVLVAFDGVAYTVTDSVPIVIGSGGGCAAGASPTTAVCSAPVGKISVTSGPQNDRIRIDPSVPASVSTSLFGHDGNDVLIGGNGNDNLIGGNGDDELHGNAGTDWADYSNSSAGVEVDLASGTASGAGADRFDPGETGTIENVRGSSGDDTINSRNNAAGTVVCGAGSGDFVLSDPEDTVSSTCEDNDDGVAPAIDISSPGDYANVAAPDITFAVTDRDSFTYSCELDGAPVDPCNSPYQPAPLADGPHSFVIRATDKYNHFRGASRDFTVDTVVPETAIDAAPDGTVDTATPSFSFSSDDPTAEFACRFDDGNFFECSSPLTPDPPLVNGPHTFEVAAIDPAGNLDQTPATASFVVNAPVPGPPPSGGTTTQAGTSNVIIGSLVLISGRSVKLVKHRLIPITLTCAGQRLCAGRVTVKTDRPVKKARKKGKKKRRARVERLGSRKFSIQGNHKKKVFVRLSRSKVKLLKRLRRVRVRATIREVDVHGRPRVSMRTFVLRAR